ncbi:MULTISPECIES: hypothetical protein [Streptomyces]|uniref:Major facilitator superfamily (MFS) profile domain-containing protein n=1 Tax=Streptomyces ramulosus TaxID=47762 RepID=A0ABW1FCQ7_9ACTN
MPAFRCRLAGVAAALAGSGGGHIALVLFLALWGTGLGILTPAIVSAALRTTPGSPGLASGASNTSRQTGGALGIALFAAIAGRADTPGFLPHAIGLLAATAALLALTGLLCLGIARSTRARPA